MTQEVKVFLAKPKHLNLVSRVYMIEGKKSTLAGYPLTSNMCHVMHTHTHTDI